MYFTKIRKFDFTNPSDKLFKTLLDGIAEYDNALRSERSRLEKLVRLNKVLVWCSSHMDMQSKKRN